MNGEEFCNSNSYGDDKIVKTLPYLFWPAGQSNLLMGGQA